MTALILKFGGNFGIIGQPGLPPQTILLKQKVNTNNYEGAEHTKVNPITKPKLNTLTYNLLIS
jgi:hypothetical protein